MGQLLNYLKTKFPFSSGKVANQTALRGAQGRRGRCYFPCRSTRMKMCMPSASAGVTVIASRKENSVGAP